MFRFIAVYCENAEAYHEHFAVKGGQIAVKDEFIAAIIA
jgi:hypothetical protein